ncbi:MAG: helix-turn-helix domain-containing protein [Dehalococcoidia bacterium]
MSERGEQRDYASGLRGDQTGDERWLSVYEVAAMVLQHPDTVRRWIADGLIQAEDRGRLGQRIPEREVQRYLATNFMNDKRNPADHALSSNVVNTIPTQNQPRERDIAGAGWPFNQRVEDSGRPLPTAQSAAPETAARLQEQPATAPQRDSATPTH